MFLNSYPLHRALVAALSFAAAIIGARLLSPEHFSTLVTAAFIAKFLHIVNFGATAGYFVSRYSEGGPLVEERAGSELRFLLYFLVHLYCLGVVVWGVTALWLPQYLVGVLAFLLLIPLFVVEPALRYRRFFSFSLAPELVLSLALLGVAVAGVAGILPQSQTGSYLWVIAILSGIVIAFVLPRQCSKHTLRHVSGFGARDYRHVLALGGPVYIGSALFIAASSADRLILPLYGADAHVGTYFLAYQLCMGAMIFLTAINFVNTVNLGEARKSHIGVNIDLVTLKLRIAVLVALVSYLALCVGGAILETLFLPASFEGLTEIVFLLGGGMAVFYISNAITPVVAYFRRQVPLTVAMALVAVALVANNAFVYLQGLGPVWLASGTAFAFALYGVFAIWFTFKTLREQPVSKV